VLQAYIDEAGTLIATEEFSRPKVIITDEDALALEYIRLTGHRSVKPETTGRCVRTARLRRFRSFPGP
jgi:hypothetical protein